MIKNIFIIIVFVITNLLEVGLLKPFFHHFLFLNMAVLVVFATNNKLYNQSLLLGLVYGIILNILFANNIFVLPIVFVLIVNILNKLSLWFGEKLTHKIVYTFVLVVLLRIVVEKNLPVETFGLEVVIAVMYTVIVNYFLNQFKQNVDF